MIGGASIGEYIVIELTTNRRITAILKDIKTFGIEVDRQDYTKKGLTFYPFHNIVSITGEFQETKKEG